MSLVSRNTIKSDWLNIASVDNSKDGMIDRFIAYADAEILNICQQPIEQTSVVFTINGNAELVYNTGYTVPFTLTSIASRDSYADAFTSVIGTCSVLDFDGVKSLYNPNGFTSLQYQVTANIGFAVIPPIIELCASELVTELFFATPFAPQANRFGVSSITESEAGMSIGKKLVSIRERIKPRLLPFIRVSI
jgi:hypothetical protein